MGYTSHADGASPDFKLLQLRFQRTAEYSNIYLWMDQLKGKTEAK